MKKMACILAIVAMTLGASVAMGEITGSGHDFSTYGWSGGQICLPCHTPHGADMDADGPLWNHELPDAAQTYTLFEGEVAVRDDALDSRSILCMGCHDGTVALDSFGGNTGVTTIGGSELIGTDLQNDHPVGADAVYPTRTSFTDPATWPSRTLRLREMDLGNPAPDLVVGCTTCHSAHNSGGYAGMLRVSNAGSGLCLFCHIK